MDIKVVALCLLAAPGILRSDSGASARDAADAAQAGQGPEFGTGSVRANGLTFHYLEAGTGPLVLALHGFPDIPRTYRHQMQLLAAQGYRVVAPFMRGYAPTDAPAGASYQSAALVQDALALVDALSPNAPVVLMGHDWGAAAAHGAAAIAPEKIAKLVTIAVPHGGSLGRAFVANPEQQRRSWYMFFFQMPYAEAAVAHDDFAFIERLWSDWSPGWALPRQELDAIKATFRRPGVVRAALNYYRHTFGAGPAAPGLDEIARRMGGPIRVRTLYLHGARDGCIGAELTADMDASYVGGFEKHILDGAGHFVHQEKPDEVNRLILEFLRR